jgi:hypothetical protein
MTPPIVVPPIRPCAWCTPRAELDALNVKYQGQISHSICELCAEKLEQLS